jgi:hypothetical protein
LGGVSSRLRGRTARQLFPYKNLPPLKETLVEVGKDSVEVEEVKAKTVLPKDMKVPKWGNAEQQQKHWTASELKRYDNFLLGWARWVTDHANGFVRSVRCEGKTKNEDGVCDMCRGVARDESFKRSLCRVCAP